LHRIAVNQCLTIKRRGRTRAEDYLDDDNSDQERIFVAAQSASPGNEVERAERTRIVRRAVDTLPVELRQVVVMKEFE
ncbi:hypothetical protein J0673_24955, partial [Vibrio sp. Vb2736]|uniref:RNA polymerase sigma factor n=1 Tax=Vibrio sp. Vb2736 TaxID=2816075 RepID=UPI001A900DD7